MADNAARIQDELMGLWKKASAMQKAVVAAGLAVVIAAVVGLSSWAGRPQYVPLFQELSLKDAAKAQGAVEEVGVSYKLRNGGRTILVPASEASRLKLSLAGKGMVFDKFDDAVPEYKFPPSDLWEKRMWRHRLERKLSATLSELEPVEYARVIIAQPDDPLFVWGEDERPVKASVVVKLRPNREPKPSQVTGMAHIVAHAVEGLAVENVEIGDTTGKLLTRPNSHEIEDVALEEKRLQLEHRLAMKARRLLEKSLGEGRVDVRVALELNTEEVREETYLPDPESKAPRDEKYLKRSNTNRRAQGAPGTSSNLAGTNRGAGRQASPQDSSTEENTEIRYDTGYRKRDIRRPAGEIERLSVAVMVDGKYETAKGADGAEKEQFVELSASALEKYEGIVKTAVGFSEERGDTIQLSCVQFSRRVDDLGPAFEKQQTHHFVLNIVKHSSIALAAVVVLLFARSLLKKIELIAPPPAQPVPVPVGGDIGALIEGQESREPKLRDQVFASVQHNPTATTKLLRGWFYQPEEDQSART